MITLTEIKKLPKRTDIPVKLTWDLDKVYSSTEEWHIDEKKLLNI